MEGQRNQTRPFGQLAEKLVGRGAAAGQETVEVSLNKGRNELLMKIVNGAGPTIDFLTRVFGATELRRIPGAPGKLMHAEVRIGDSVIMLGDAVPPAWTAVPCHVHIYVPDVDATYRRALEAGASSVQEPVQKEG